MKRLMGSPLRKRPQKKKTRRSSGIKKEKNTLADMDV